MEKHIFFSDVHLSGFTDEENSEIEKTFKIALKWATKNDFKIWFLGDIFDYWMEYKNGFYPSEFDSIIAELSNLKKKQNELVMITGNHDNWTRTKFQEYGITIEKDFHELITFDSRKILLKHGDGLFQAPNKMKRPLFHNLLRNSLFVWFFQLIFKDRTGISIMKWFSQYNRKIRPTTDKSALKLTKWFQNMGYRLPYSYIICGHDHIARMIRKNNCEFVNLGAFYSEKTAAIYTDKIVQLVKWDEINQEFKPLPTSL